MITANRGLVDPATPIQQGGEERAGAQLRDPQSQITSGRGHGAGSGAVALVGARRAAFPRLGTDRGRQLGLDQRLTHRLGRDPDTFTGITGLQRLQNLE
jgi:hypothetical protein